MSPFGEGSRGRRAAGSGGPGGRRPRTQDRDGARRGAGPSEAPTAEGRPSPVDGGGAARPTSSFTGGEPARARDIVLRQLAAAPRSRVELERALARKEVDPEVAREVLDRFTEIQLVDDAGYAELVVRSQRAGRGLARQGLAHELRKRGVDPQTAEQALSVVTAEEELETARSLVARRLPATARLERPVRVRRLVGLLARKGYDGGTAMRVVTEALGAEADGSGPPAPDDDPVPEQEAAPAGSLRARRGAVGGGRRGGGPERDGGSADADAEGSADADPAHEDPAHEDPADEGPADEGPDQDAAADDDPADGAVLRRRPLIRSARAGRPAGTDPDVLLEASDDDTAVDPPSDAEEQDGPRGGVSGASRWQRGTGHG